MQYELITAAEERKLEEVKRLLAAGAAVNVSDKQERTALHMSAWNGDISITKLLLANGADIKPWMANGWTALHLAVWQGHEGVVKLLLEAGADVRVIGGEEKRTALHLSAWQGHSSVAELLLEKGSALTILNEDWKQKTPLQIAISRNKDKVVELLQVAEFIMGQEIDITEKFCLSINKGITSLQNFLLNQGEIDLKIVLLYALDFILGQKGSDTRLNNTKLLDRLLDNTKFKVYLYSAELLDYYKYLFFKLLGRDIEGRTLKNIREVDINNQSDKDGNTVLHLAVLGGYKNIVQSLLTDYQAEDLLNGEYIAIEDKLDINISNIQGDNALIMALRSQNIDIANMLLDIRELNCKTVNKLGENSLTLAAELGDSDIIRKLLEGGCGSYVNDKNPSGKTALHLAVELGYTKIVKILCFFGVELGVRGLDRKTALDLAMMRGDKIITKILLQQEVEIEDNFEFVGLLAQEYDIERKKERSEYIGRDNVTSLDRDEDISCDDGFILGAKIDEVKTVRVSSLKGDLREEQSLGVSNLRISRDFVGSGGGEESSESKERDISLSLDSVSVTASPRVMEIIDGYSKDEEGLKRIPETFDLAAIASLTIEEAFIDEEKALQKLQMLITERQLSSIDVARRKIKDSTLLDLAVTKKYIKAVELLLRNNVKLDLVNHSDLAELLFLSIDNSNQYLVKKILDQGLKIDDITDISGNTTLMRLALKKYDKAQCQSDKQILELLLTQDLDINLKDRYGDAAIMIALHRGCNKGVAAELVSNYVSRLNKDDALFAASYVGNIERINELLEAGVSINLCDRYDKTALHWAVVGGDVLMIRLLLTKGVNIEGKDRSDLTPLHLAALFGYRDVMEALLKAGAKTNIKSSEECTPLHWAALFGHRDVIEDLLEAGANINIKNSEGRTALHLAAQNGHWGAARLLLEREADIAATLTGAFDAGKTALHIAVEYDKIDIVALLLQKGADITILSAAGKSGLDIAKARGYIEIENLITKSALILVQGNNTASFIRALEENILEWQAYFLSRGDINIKQVLHFIMPHLSDTYRSSGDEASKEAIDSKQYYADILYKISADEILMQSSTKQDLELLFGYFAKIGQLDRMKWLLGTNININAPCDKTQKTALMFAAQYGHLEIVQLLLDQETIDLAIEDINGDSASDLALRNEYHEIGSKILSQQGHDTEALLKAMSNPKRDLRVVESITEFNADIDISEIDEEILNRRNDRGESCLLESIKKRYINTATLLLQSSKVDVDLMDQKGNYALIVAAEWEILPIVQSLLLKTANVNMPSGETGDTAIIAAAKHGHSQIIRLMLEYNKHSISFEKGKHIDFNWVNAEGDTALLAALKAGHADIARLLLTCRAVSSQIVNKAGETAFYLAVELGDVDIVRELLAEGLPAEYGINHLTNGLTAIMNASISGHENLLPILKSYGADLEAETAVGDTALMLAVRYNKIASVKSLLELGANINHKNKEDNTVFDIVAEGGEAFAAMSELLLSGEMDEDKIIEDAFVRWHLTIVEELENKYHNLDLSKFDVDVLNEKNKEGASRLIEAIKCGYNLLVAKLLDAEGIDVAIFDEFGETALILAVKKQNAELVKILLPKIDNCELYHKNNDDYSAWDWVIANGYKDLQKLFIDRDPLLTKFIVASAVTETTDTATTSELSSSVGTSREGRTSEGAIVTSSDDPSNKESGVGGSKIAEEEKGAEEGDEEYALHAPNPGPAAEPGPGMGATVNADFLSSALLHSEAIGKDPIWGVD